MRSLNETLLCQHCNGPFHPHYGRPGSKYCSRRCATTARWGEPPTRICSVCGQPATGTGKRSQKQCSWACAQVAKRGRANPARMNQETRFCAVCEKGITRAASNFHSEVALCSKRCRSEWHADFSGPLHPRWKGGPPRTYGIGWKKARADEFRESGGICRRDRKSTRLNSSH